MRKPLAIKELVGKTIVSASLMYDSLVMLFGDGEYYAVRSDCNCSTDGDCSIGEHVFFTADSDAEYFGVCTPEEHKAAVAARKKRDEDHERAEFDRLKKKFEAPPVAPPGAC